MSIQQRENKSLKTLRVTLNFQQLEEITQPDSIQLEPRISYGQALNLI